MQEPEGMGEDAFLNFVTSEIRDTIGYINSDVSKRREMAINYINLDMPDLPVMVGRSSVVDATVGSQIGLMMPGLMRIMVGGPRVVEYVAQNPADERATKVASDYVNNVVFKLDNEGERVVYDWGYDGLTQVVGSVKAYWLEEYEYKEETFERISDDQFAQLFQSIQADPSLEIVAHEAQSILDQVDTVDPMGQPVTMVKENNLHTLTVKKTINVSKACIENMPPEEFIVSRSARSLEDAVLRSHRTYKRAGELKELGYDPAKVDAIPTYEDFTTGQTEWNKFDRWKSSSDQKDPDMRKVAVHQAIVKCNFDGTGIKEWYCVLAGNESQVDILEIEEYDCQVIFADFCPQPLPHTFYGRCPADDLVPIQKVKTATIRQTMDNLYKANTPQRIVATAGLQKGGLEALQNQVPGGLVLANSVDAVRDLAVPFFAQHSFPMLAYWDEEAQKRTGVSMAAMALNPDVLQNQSATAANLAQSAAMSKLEMIARIWATGGMRKLFRGILKILKKYQDFPRNMKVDGGIVPINPQDWPQIQNWDVSINTGLGTGSRDKDLTMLAMIEGKQAQIIQAGGPQNGVVTPGQYANTIRKMIEATGIQNTSQFVNDVPTDFTGPEPQPPQPTPDTVVNAEALKQIEGMKVQQKQAEAQARIASDQQVKVAELASRERIALADIESRERIASGELGVKTTANQIEAARTALESDVKNKDQDIKVAQIIRDANKPKGATRSSKKQ
jgi:hypothetical protein